MAETDYLFANEELIDAADFERIVAALLSAYGHNLDFLYLRVANKLSLQVGIDVVALNNPGRLIVSALVDHARAQGRTLELLGAAWSDVPGNPALRRLADKYLPNQPGVMAKFATYTPSPQAVVPAARPSLEKLIDSRSRRFNLANYIDGLGRLAGAICTVGTPQLQGTGFLVGKRSVLTNFHVVKDAIRGSYGGDKILCTFDYHDATTPNVVLHGAADWLRSNSPYSQSDLSGTGQPAPDELDYALITLAKDVEPSRRALDWPIAAPIVAQRDFLMIAQHPGGDPAEIAFGEVVDIPQPGLRYRYDVTTLPGSSGSPVLSVDLELVALHHAADPQANPRYNQAVPIARIMAKLKAEGIDLAAL